jgi:PadR family transcriptional regulator, regulatory protein AphA
MAVDISDRYVYNYQTDMSSPNATARVILALLAFGPRTGYDIKRFTDSSTRFFWRASYGQIYPELRKLEAAGLVRSRDEPYGRRVRRVHELTAKGRRELAAWLHSDDDQYEVRDEGLLRLFFGELLSGEELLELVRRRRSWYAESAALFRGIGEELGEVEGPSGDVLRYGIELMEWNLEWWTDLERRLSDRPA